MLEKCDFSQSIAWEFGFPLAVGSSWVIFFILKNPYYLNVIKNVKAVFISFYLFCVNTDVSFIL